VSFIDLLQTESSIRRPLSKEGGDGGLNQKVIQVGSVFNRRSGALFAKVIHGLDHRRSERFMCGDLHVCP
jgi:hypothetical protein